jgi:penicillin-insensitive murein endopeptidase
MRPSRGRYYGHPRLVAWVEGFARGAAEDGWPDFLIGDMAQPRGGPMITGHASHQLGLEVDIWFATPRPRQMLTIEEREGTPTVEMVRRDLLEVDPAQFTPAQLEMLYRAALSSEVDRIFVNAAIKRAACRGATSVRHWLRKVRPWPGHTQHFHVALKCTDAGCAARNPIPAGDGCGKELDHWFRAEVRFPKVFPRPPRPLKLNDLPKACRQVLAAPG